MPPRETFNPKSEEEIKPGHKDGKEKKTNTGDTAATIHHAEEVKGFYACSLISYLESPTSCILQMLLF